MRLPFFVALALAAPASAQYAFPAAQPQTPADQLAAVMRRLAAAPTDVYALIQAGELSVKLDDMSAAAAFFARADRIDPRNGRVKAGMASILVRAERPGEALRYFQLAEGLGHSLARFAADRGLAYDLLGEQERAQRDYRLALRSGPRDDETVRRYALSLGISGRRALALDQLEPLIRRQDRAAWRVRAFVLAMGGDVGGANKIAAAVMPAGMSAGLRPFFDRLPALSAADRAFAVHFGEIRPTPARLADARMKPFLAPLGPDQYAPAVQVAAAPLAPVPQPARARAGSRRDERREPAQVASSRVRAPVRAALPQTTVAPALAQATPGSAPSPPVAVAARPSPPPASPPAQMASVAPLTVAPAISPIAQPSPPVSVPPSSPTLLSAAVATPAPSPVAVAAITRITPRPVAGPPAPEVVASGYSDPAPSFAAPVPSAAPAIASVAPVAPVAAVRSEDSILARIVASITVPGEELGIAQPARRVAPVVATVIDPAARRTLAVGRAEAARETADRAAAARTIAAAEIESAGSVRRTRATAPSDRPARAREGRVQLAARGPRAARVTGPELAGDQPARARRDTAERAAKASARGGAAAADVEPRTAAERRAAERRVAAENKTGKASTRKDEGEPGRIWVQVAAGPEERGLGRAWTAAQKKAAALRGRAGYSTSSRATNRVLTGPFKTAAEARALVNQLARQGVSAFQFTSASGQTMTKLRAE